MSSTPIPLGRADYRRGVAQAAEILLLNRYFEVNPILTEDQVALLARPGLRRALQISPDGPVRFTYTSPGAFNDDMFVVVGLFLYRINSLTLGVTNVGQIGQTVTQSVSMAATGNIGTTPGHLFLCDGGVLWCYTEDGYAIDHLESTGVIINTETVTIDGVVYEWTNASVDAGAPAGTVGNPWLVKLGADAAESLSNLFAAINATGLLGTDYSTALVAHPTVTAYNSSATELYVRAKSPGATGNVLTASETGAHIAWASGTFAGGGTPTLLQVPVPDDAGAISLAHINSFIIVIPVQGRGVNGRFYWIQPGETTIDPLDFATAERATDPVSSVVVFGDQFWLPGTTTTETWFMSGDPDAPMQRAQGILFDHGSWPGTALQVSDSLIIVDDTGRVWQIAGQRAVISTPDIEERIRSAMQRQRLSGL